jgi:hypothetical protein
MAGDGDDGVERWLCGQAGGGRGWGQRRWAQGRLGVGQCVGRWWLGLVGDGDDGAEGRPAWAWAAALGAEASVEARNEKTK